MPPPGFRKLVEQALPGTYAEIIAKSGLGKSTVKRWLLVMRAERAVYIAKWLRCDGHAGSGGKFMPYFRAGSRKDAPCTLKRYTSAETSRAYMKKARANGHMAEIRARSNMKKVADRAAKRCDPLVAALFGKSRAVIKEVV